MSTSANQALTGWRHFQVRDLPEVKPWVKRLGRFGYYAKAVVYAVVGVLALQLAIGSGGETTGAQGAIEKIGQEPFGRTMLACVAIGLFGYALWRSVQVVKDTEGDGTGAKGIVKRTGYAISGLSYLFLGGYAAAIAIGLTSRFGSSGSSGQDQMAAGLVTQTWGQIVLSLVGVVLIVTAICFVYTAYRARFMEKYPLGAMRGKMRVAALHIGRAGVATRGLAFAIIGWFLIKAAMTSDSSEIKGLEGVLAEIAAQPYGKVLLGTAAFGLICYALHCAIKGTYRRFNLNG